MGRGWGPDPKPSTPKLEGDSLGPKAFVLQTDAFFKAGIDPLWRRFGCFRGKSGFLVFTSVFMFSIFVHISTVFFHIDVRTFPYWFSYFYCIFLNFCLGKIWQKYRKIWKQYGKNMAPEGPPLRRWEPFRFQPCPSHLLPKPPSGIERRCIHDDTNEKSIMYRNDVCYNSVRLCNSVLPTCAHTVPWLHIVPLCHLFINPSK